MRTLSFCSNRYGWSGESERGWLVVGDEGFDVIWLSFVFALLFAVCCCLLLVKIEACEKREVIVGRQQQRNPQAWCASDSLSPKFELVTFLAE